MKRLVAALVLAALAFGLGFGVGRGRELEPALEPTPAPDMEVPPSGEELWQSLPPELLANVAEGKMEEIASLKSRIKRLEADLERVGEIQREKMENTAP